MPRRDYDRSGLRYLGRGLLILWLGVLPGCGGTGGGGGSNGADNQNQNGNENDNQNVNGNANGNANDNGGGPPPPAELTAEIGGLPAAAADVGDQIQLTATVTNEVGDLTYEWGVDLEDVATLSATDIADPMLSALQPGQVAIILAVTDLATGEMTKAAAQLVIAGTPEPPPEAAIDVLAVPPVRPGESVTLQATLSGPAPASLDWLPDPDNDLDADALSFIDLGGGLATFIVSDLLNFTYQLGFTITAAYTDGSMLSEELVVTVFGGP